MAEWLRIGATIATPLGLIGFVATLIAIGYYRFLRYQENQLEKLPADNRAQAVDQMLSRYKIDGTNLTREQKYELIRLEMDHKAGRARLAFVVFPFVVLIALAIVVAAYLYRPEPASRTIILRLSFQDNYVERKFSVTFEDEAGRRYAPSGEKGEAQIDLPGNVHLLKNVVVNLPCFRRKGDGPLDVIEGKPIIIQLEEVATPLPPPLFPPRLPDPKMIIPGDEIPDEAALRTPPIIKKPGRVMFEHENRTGEFLRILLHSFEENRRGNPWRVLPSDPCKGLDFFNGFEETTGWYAVVLRREDGKIKYLRCIDFYAKERTRLIIELKAGELTGRFE